MLDGALRGHSASEQGAAGAAGHLGGAPEGGWRRATTPGASNAHVDAPWVANPPWALLVLSRAAGDVRSAWRWRDEDGRSAAVGRLGTEESRWSVDGGAGAASNAQGQVLHSDVFVFSAVQSRPQEVRDSRLSSRRYKRPSRVSKPTAGITEPEERAEKEARLRRAAVAHAALASAMTGQESSARAAMRVGRALAGVLHVEVVFRTLEVGALRVRAARVVQAAYRWHRGRALEGHRRCVQPGSAEMFEVCSLKKDWRLQRLVHGVGSTRDMHEVLRQQWMDSEQWLATEPPGVAFLKAVQSALKVEQRTSLVARMQAGSRAAVVEAVRVARRHTTRRVCWERYVRQLWHDLQELVATGERGQRSARAIQAQLRLWLASRAGQREPESTPSPQQTRPSNGASQVEASTSAVRRSLDYGGSGGTSEEQDEPQWLIDAEAALMAIAVPPEDSLAQPRKPRTQGQERRRAKDLARLAKRGTG